MELTERELLIKIEQQLKSLSDSHKEVLSEISTLFEKQDKDSKLLAVLTSEFKNHTDNVKSDREDAAKRCEYSKDHLIKRLSKTEGHIEKLFAELESARLATHEAKSNLNKDVDKNTSKIEALANVLRAEFENSLNEINAELSTQITEEVTNRKSFETKLTIYVKSSKVFISIIAFLITLITSIVYPIVITLFRHWLSGGAG